MIPFIFFKSKSAKREISQKQRLLEIEVEKQGVLAVASRLDTAKEQKEFINDYWTGKLGYSTPTIESEEENND